jgi:hypothetical protein
LVDWSAEADVADGAAEGGGVCSNFFCLMASLHHVPHLLHHLASLLRHLASFLHLVLRFVMASPSARVVVE